MSVATIHPAAADLANLPPWLSAKALARLFGVSPRSFCNWAERGEFPRPVRFGHVRRWRRESVAEFVSRQESAACAT